MTELLRAGASVPDRPQLRIFSDMRLHQAAGGAVHAADTAGGAGAWDVYVDRFDDVELAARVGPAGISTGVPIGRIRVCALPFYSGPRELLTRLPRVLLAVRRATTGASLYLFRLPGTISLIGAAWCRLRGRRYVVEVVGDPAGVLRSGVLGAPGRWLARASGRLMRYAVGGATAGRFVTTHTLQTLYPLAPGAAEHSYSNVRLVEEDFTPRPRTDPRPVRRLIAVGTHEQLYKGHDDLIGALSLLAVRGINVHLGIVGDGRYHHLLQELACVSGVDDRVTFHGRVNARDDLRRLLDEADLFCMPSRTEGLPRALIEAMARGLPSMGTLVGGIPELIEPRFCAPPGDAEALAALIATFADGSVDLVRTSCEVWQRAHDFAPSRQAERVSDWLDEITNLVHPFPRI